ncbi:hypothetical protein JHK84_034521 [Glycine max]|nr:hypothetical protein JHK84_034521 [Glycine max]
MLVHSQILRSLISYELKKLQRIQQEVYDYLVDSAASVQTRESINEFLTSVKQHDLTKTEVLNILNIGPAADFELYPFLTSPLLPSLWLLIKLVRFLSIGESQLMDT